MTLYKKHIAFVEKVNKAKATQEHATADLFLRAWRQGVMDALPNLSRGTFLMAADLFYLDQGIDRPMCCGVWLDWCPDAGKE